MKLTLQSHKPVHQKNHAWGMPKTILPGIRGSRVPIITHNLVRSRLDCSIHIFQASEPCHMTAL